MKKITLILLLSTSYIFANINIIVSIVPQITFVKAIGGDKVNISLMVNRGNSPHTYEPKPSQMRSVSRADIYFAIDVEFEKIWLSKFQSLNSKMKIINTAKNIDKINIKHYHKKRELNRDPHIWTSPKNVKIIAKNIYDALVLKDFKNQDYYKFNFDRFITSIEKTDRDIKNILSFSSGKFMVFHPSWGYFAKDYNLEQMPIEIEGKEPKLRELIKILIRAKKEKINAIFTQPEFSDKVAKIIANELKIPVIKVSPLAPNWSKNLIKIAKSIAGED